jgi:putative MATE family efflux protein
VKKVDATQGSLVKLIFIYTIPLILSTILQSLFSIADKAVLGNMAGSTAVASIGATGTVTELIINGAVGLSTGTAIVLARFVGQKDEKKIRTTIDTSIIASLAFGIAVAVAGLILSPVFLTATNCPEECFGGALIYMRIYLSAAPATLLYNYGSAILRTLGDTKRPLAYITVAGVVNVVLNIILCFILQEKVAAVAIATVASKLISAILVFRRICKLDDSARVRIRKMRFDLSSFFRILRFGIPSSISKLVMPLGNLQIVSAINSFGSDAVAGFSAATSVNSIAMAFSSGFGAATTTFIGQNIGAQNVSRVKKSFWYFLLINLSITGALGVIMYLTGEIWIGIIVGADSVAAINYGMYRMLWVTLFMFINAINQVLTNALQAFGYPMLTSITNIAFNLGFRILWMQFIYPLKPEFSTIVLCFTVSWILNMIFYAIFTSIVYFRYTRKGICKKI